MPGESAETMIGVAGIGMGVVLLYGAYRNLPVFGPNGIITQAITTGKVVTPGTIIGTTVGDAVLKTSIILSLRNVTDKALVKSVTDYTLNGVGDAAKLAAALKAAGRTDIANLVTKLAGQRAKAAPAFTTPPPTSGTVTV